MNSKQLLLYCLLCISSFWGRAQHGESYWIVESRTETVYTMVDLLTKYNPNQTQMFPRTNGNIGSKVYMHYISENCNNKTFSYTISLTMAEELVSLGSGASLMSVCPEQAYVINRAFMHDTRCSEHSFEKEPKSLHNGLVINNTFVVDNQKRNNLDSDMDGTPPPKPYMGQGGSYTNVALAPLSGSLETDVNRLNKTFEKEKEYKLFFGGGRTKSSFVNIAEGILRWAAIAAIGYIIYDAINDDSPQNASPNSPNNPNPNNPGDYNPGNG